MLILSRRLLQKKGHCVINVPDMWWENQRVTIHIAVVEALRSVGYELRNTIIWSRLNIVNNVGIFGWPSNYITMGTTFEYLLDFWRPEQSLFVSGGVNTTNDLSEKEMDIPSEDDEVKVFEGEEGMQHTEKAIELKVVSSTRPKSKNRQKKNNEAEIQEPSLLDIPIPEEEK